MRILYDLASTQGSKGVVHGGGAYGEVVFSALLEKKADVDLEVTCRPNRDLPLSHEDLEEQGVKVRYTDGPPGLQRLLNRESYDRFYSPLPYHLHDIDFGATDVVYTIHGLRPIELPTDTYEARYASGLKERAKVWAKQWFPNRYVSWRAQQFEKLLQVRARSLTVVVPSQHTKYALAERFPFVEPGETRVLYSPEVGRDVEPIWGDDLEESDLARTHSFLLLVSGGRWVKNAIRVVHAVDQLFTDFPDLTHRMVLTGVTDTSIFGGLQNPERFVFLEYVARSSLEALYQDADLFIYPTLNEGFGYPPLEAMRYGTPVACSAVCSIPEICGAAPSYFDPRSVSEIRARVLQLCLDASERARRSQVGRDRYIEVQRQQTAMLDTLCSLILGRDVE